MLRSLSAMLLLTSAMVAGQRPSFAGFRPIGFPDLPNKTTTTQDPLGDRFGEVTTERLPAEAHGDRDLIDRLSKLPIDKQPFWFINWQAYEANRNKPQTYPQRPNVFIDSSSQTNAGSSNQGASNSNQEIPNNSQAFSNSNQGISNNNQAFSNSNQGIPNNNQGFPNRNQGILNNSQIFSNSNQGIPNNNQGLSNSNQGILNDNQALSNPNSGFSNANTGLTNGSNGFSNLNLQYPSSNIGLTNPSHAVSNSNPGNLNNNSGVPNSNLGSVNTNSGSTNPNVGLPASIPGGANVNSSSSGAGFAGSVSDRFGDVPNVTNSNYNINYKWNNTYQQAAFFDHFYNTSYYVPNDGKPSQSTKSLG